MKSYDDNKPSKHVIYLDVNNLYGWAMSQYLPYNGFKWWNKKEVDRFDVNSISKNNWHEYILEPDVEYPDELQVLHNDYPLTSEKLEISRDMLSKFCNNIANEHGHQSRWC